MVLAIDIGNSSIALGGFIDDELRFVARISTDVTKTDDEYAASMLSALSLYGIERTNITGAVISSVVPVLSSVFKRAVSFLYGIEPLMVGPGIKTGINIRCDDPSSVGSDLICATVAAHHIYSSPALVIDMGTATKMILVDKKGAFSGVSILPGVQMGLRALSDDTAQLPQVSLDAPSSVIGKNTADAMRSGLIFGNAAMIDGMIDRVYKEMGAELPVYATGGLAETVIKHCSHTMVLDESLVLKGLNILYKKNN